MVIHRLGYGITSFINCIEKRINIGVGTKIFIPFFIVILSVIGVISYFATSTSSEKMQKIQQRRAAAVLNTTVENLKVQSKSIEAYARLLADSPVLEEALTGRDYKRLYEILTPAKYYADFEKIILYNREGEIVSQLDSKAKPNREEDKLVTKALAGITSSGFGITENGLELYAGTPVKFDPAQDESEMPIGALIIDRHISQGELIEIKNREGVEINIIYAGELISSTLDRDTRDTILPGLLESMKKGNQFQVVSPRDGSQYINIWKNIGSEGIVSVLIPNDDILAAQQETSEDIFRITVMTGIMVFFISLLLAKVIVRPLIKMLNTTTAITHGDFSKKIEVITGDEFGQLGKAINYMADRIKERLEQAELLATLDGLTGLYNHRYFQQRLQEEIERAERFSLPLSLVMMDIDCFKHYNDSQGHPAGDRVLRSIGEITRKTIRGVDIAARYGGEEFALILIDTGPDQALMVGERIRKEVESYPFDGRDEQPAGRLTISLGIATYPVNATRKDDLIKMADDALYKAKYISKNKVVLYYSVLDELKTELDKSELDLINTIKTLISVINSKDKYTYGHSERVVQYSVMIAEAFKLPEKDLKNIKVGAYLHDIGKIEIDRELLNKQGPLSEAEMNIIQQHPAWGAQIVSSVKSLKDVVPMILYHHEKFNGGGYPMGIKGEQIPFEARILKVADSFDAMTSLRPYQGRKSYEQSREELVKCSGADFDPDIVEVFLEILDNTKFEDGRLIS
ncbi:MAG: hypothetical protein CVU89_09005 [Firmicutes bacterium HGW-Firmicutes-14]|nr:MAG: hypothetical protein CVU89_09005 [Firmicutes bacterium HGW-Firmicutes-14]